MSSWYVYGLYGGGIGFLFGVAIFLSYELSSVTIFLVAGASVVCAGLYRFYRQDWFWLGAIIFIAISLGMARAEAVLPLEKSLPIEVEETVTIEGKVVTDPELRARSQHLEVETLDTEILAIVDRHHHIAYGDRVELTGEITKPEPFSAELGRVFQYDGYLAAQGISHTMFYPEVAVVESGLGNPIISTLFTLKHLFRTQLEKIIPEPQSALATGLLLGERRALSENKLEEFRSTGIIHIVVLSGMSVMFVVSFVQYVFGLFLYLRLRIVFSIVAVLGFAIMVGLSPTVVRASIMASMFLLAQFMGRSYLALRGLIVSAVVMVAVNPIMLVYDIGFQLSFMATLGLVLVAPHLEQMMASVPSRIPLKTYFIATVATQIAVLPLLLYQVGEFSVVSPLVNMLVVPMVPFAMLLAFITGLIGLLLPSATAVVAFPTFFSLEYILFLSRWFADLPFTSFWVPAFPFGLVVISYLAMAIAYWWYTKQRSKNQTSQPIKPSAFALVADWKIVPIEDFLADYKQPEQRTKTSPATLVAGEEKESVPIFFR